MASGTFLPPGLSRSIVKIESGGTDNYVMTAVDGETIQGEVNLQFDSSTLTVTGDAVITDDLTLNSDSAVFNMGDDSGFSITHDGDLGATIAGSPITITAAEASTWSTSSGALTITSAAAATWSTAAGNLTLTAGGSTGDVLIGDGDGTILYVDGGLGNVLIGVASADVSAKLLIESTGTGFQSQLSFTNPQAHAAGVGHAIAFYGSSGDQNMAAIQVAWVGSSASNGAYMQFATRRVSDGSLIPRMKIIADDGDIDLLNHDLLNVGASGNDIVAGSASSSDMAIQTGGTTIELQAIVGIGYAGGATQTDHFIQGENTQNVAQSALTLHDFTHINGGLVMVTGQQNSGAANKFIDLVLCGETAGNTPTVVSAHTVAGTPPARTYAMASAGVLTLVTDGSSGWDCNVLTIASGPPN